MNPEDVQKIVDILKEALGPTGQWLWQVTRQGVIVSAWTDIVMSLAFFVNAFLCYRIVRRCLTETDTFSGTASFVVCCWAIVSLFLLVVGIISTFMAIQTLIVPDYYTLRALLGK